ncbi:MAG TPA: hypothetical protein VGL42_10305 [Opitutaceae bacterium]|jgi:hypothetical protein
MKLGLGLIAVICAACSSAPQAGITLAPVGPAAESTPQPGDGTLVVFSAYISTEFGSNTPSYRRYHSAYRIFGPDGSVLKSVSNQSGPTSEEPSVVPLAPGKYRVEAMANGYGWVTVPVVIEAGRPTIVKLDGPVDSTVK